ncbi:hypothetical protein BN970_03485 [Mycolicibacterium conceptionense]|uniref:Uncharacterized protein n=1 Tax=Mycolicibacterium conceptionense TaxID=451644 RepID=A0A0U1DH37_9MYCO|nr:hypothetical protein BN970_03485 [Mycolicibacterium conceptionense]
MPTRRRGPVARPWSTARRSGVHGAGRRRGALAQQPHLIHRAGLRGRHTVHHQHAGVALAGEHHGRGTAGGDGAGDRPHVRSGEDLLGRRGLRTRAHCDADADAGQGDDDRRRGRQPDVSPACSGPWTQFGHGDRRQQLLAQLRRRLESCRSRQAGHGFPYIPHSVANWATTSGEAAARRCSMSARSLSDIACSAYGVARSRSSESSGSVMPPPDNCAGHGGRRASAI